jgi:VWFA-related protein
MAQRQIIYALVILAVFANACSIDSQTSAVVAKSPTPYHLDVSVDEVILTFHAADAHGLPINDLKLEELSILDNNAPPRRMLDFQILKDFPIRAGILMDTSESIEKDLPGNRAIAIQYAQRLLRQRTDQAFVMDFGYGSNVIRPWSSDSTVLTAGIRRVIAGRENPLGGTALFDAIFRACFYEFGKIDQAASGNFILLFSDGVDNASHTSLREAVDVCQRTNTAIYAFRAEPRLGFSTGPNTLVELTSQTGGRVFHSDDAETKIDNDLRSIEADIRNQYRLIYKPAELKHDGSFHHIELRAPERVDSVSVRSGYYAPAH